jgi:RecA/RadA recombinase
MADLSQLRRLIIQKWPEAVLSNDGLSEPVFHTGIASLDALFPRRGIPYGQMIEITGAVGSGKTSLLFMMTGALTKSGMVAYIDLSGSFFPTAAASCGVDVEKLSIVKPDNFVMGLRNAELLLSHQRVDSIVVDLTSAHPSTALRTTGQAAHKWGSGATRAVGTTTVSTSAALLHRLRQQVARSKALVIFLTDNGNDSKQFLPASMVSLRLEVSRLMRSQINITVTKSRISREGAHTEVLLNE